MSQNSDPDVKSGDSVLLIVGAYADQWGIVKGASQDGRFTIEVEGDRQAYERGQFRTQADLGRALDAFGTSDTINT